MVQWKMGVSPRLVTLKWLDKFPLNHDYWRKGHPIFHSTHFKVRPTPLRTNKAMASEKYWKTILSFWDRHISCVRYTGRTKSFAKWFVLGRTWIKSNKFLPPGCHPICHVILISRNLQWIFWYRIRQERLDSEQSCGPTGLNIFFNMHLWQVILKIS